MNIMGEIRKTKFVQVADMELSSPNIVKGGNSMSASCMAAPLWWHRQRVMIHTVHLVSKILQNFSDFAEIWTHNTVQHEETENGICKPFCQNPSIGFTKYYYFLVSNSHYCWCKQFWSQLNGWFIRYEWWNLNQQKLSSKTAYINSNVNLIPKSSSIW